MAHIDLLRTIHTRTKRNYLERVDGVNKAECARIAKRFDRDYWDGDRKHGYGGYRYDGRWRALAAALIDRYGLESRETASWTSAAARAHLLYDLGQLLPGIEVAGIDVSQYALDHAMPTVKPFLRRGNATELPWEDRIVRPGAFDQRGCTTSTTTIFAGHCARSSGWAQGASMWSSIPTGPKRRR